MAGCYAACARLRWSATPLNPRATRRPARFCMRRPLRRRSPDTPSRRRSARGGWASYTWPPRTGSQERVALKVLRPKVVVDPYQRAVFLREMELMEGLRHPNIVAFLGGGEQNGGFYFAMEYCDGGSVEQLLKAANGPLPLRTAGPIMLQVLKGLAHAHERDLVHRDLKPQEPASLRIEREADGEDQRFRPRQELLQSGPQRDDRYRNVRRYLRLHASGADHRLQVCSGPRAMCGASRRPST